jgi:hypothetical protein
MCWGMRTKRCKERDVDGSVVSDLERQWFGVAIVHRRNRQVKYQYLYV